MPFHARIGGLLAEDAEEFRESYPGDVLRGVRRGLKTIPRNLALGGGRIALAPIAPFYDWTRKQLEKLIAAGVDVGGLGVGFPAGGAGRKLK